MEKAHKRMNSIMNKILLPMAIAMIVQAGLFSGNILWGGTIEKLNNNAFDILNEQVINRKNYLENEMVQRWSNVGQTADAIRGTISEFIAGERRSGDYHGMDSALESKILLGASDQLIGLMRQNSVTGAFLILEGKKDQYDALGKLQKTALYIRDMDPTTYLADNSDLLIEYAPPSVTKALGISLDSKWQAHMQFDPQDKKHWDFYHKPFEAAMKHPDIGEEDLGYWCGPFRLDETGLEVITYSIPLRSGTGGIYGVIGVEITLDYLRSLIPYQEINADKKGMYLLGLDDSQDMNFDVVLSTGPAFTHLFGGEPSVGFSRTPVYGNSYELLPTERTDQPVYGCVQYLTLYNSNTPFEYERWALIGILERKQLLGFSDGVARSVWGTWGISLLIGLLAAWFASLLLARPVIRMVRQVRESDPLKPLQLEKINIYEVDELAGAIESLSDRVVQAANRLSQIIDIAGVPIGAFEYLPDTGRVYCTERFFVLLDIRAELAQDGTIDSVEFQNLIAAMGDRVEERRDGGQTRILRLYNEVKGTHWVRLKVVEENGKAMGVVSDITQEVLERRKIERERDYDLLTNLLNRRAFTTELSKHFENPQELGIGALIMLDLDNLKFINDSYGHDYGDEYIRCMANALKRHTPYHALVSRMSGDEFYVFLYGYHSREEVRGVIAGIHNGIQSTEFPLPDNEVFRVRASAGIAWYPDDSGSYEMLIKYADFAMYKVKNTTKGEFNEFDMESYNRDSYLLHNKEELNRLIDGELVTYHFQPIVDARKGEIFGYEALMRSTLPTIKSPLEILALAKSQSKLYSIERLTWRKSLECFSKLTCVDPKTCLFINSIANQILNETDIKTVQDKYAPMLPRVVVEFTEEEKSGEDCTRCKREMARRWYAKIALDDFGTGYNSDVALLSISPDFVKIDISIVRNIDSDVNRQNILQNLISYSKARGIKVIAEGVETHAEMETLVRSGVDYLQGFYVAMPQPIPRRIDPQVKKEILEAAREAVSDAGKA